MSISGPILVFLANGVQGSAVVRAARQRGHVARALMRARPDHATDRDAVIADLDDPASLRVAAHGCAHAVLQIPAGAQPRMMAQAQAALDALLAAGTRSLVLKLGSASRPAPCPNASFVANAAIEALFRHAGIPFAVVRPTMYLDNLLKPSARTDIIDRALVSPPIARDQRIAWTCVDDAAHAAILLLEQGRHGGDHLVCGPQAFTGDELAEQLSIGLARQIAFRAEPVALFEHDVAMAMGADMAARIAARFRYFAEHRDDADRMLGASPTPLRLPGFHPISIAEWARRHRSLFR